jgi:hypothetical protein
MRKIRPSFLDVTGNGNSTLSGEDELPLRYIRELGSVGLMVMHRHNGLIERGEA